jgi:shikimate dehydrogenase
LGSPIAHSLSPALHRAAYRELGLRDWSYDAVDVTEAQLPAFLASLGPDWAGLSLTMPLKRAVLALVDHVDDLAEAIGGANTVLFGAAESVALTTDVRGMVAAITQASGCRTFESATILGGGATATAALAAVAELGVAAPRVFVRSVARASGLVAAAARMGLRPQLRRLRGDDALVDWPDNLVVATLPPRAADAMAQAFAQANGRSGAVRPAGGSSGGVEGGVRGRLLLDVAYDPWPSRLATAWAAAGGAVASGLTMLLHQAAEQVRLMTGQPAPLAAMRAVLPGGTAQ